MTLALISNIANYLKYNYFWDCEGIDNVTLRLWKFSDFCSRHIVGVAGDDIMFHILVVHMFKEPNTQVKISAMCYVISRLCCINILHIPQTQGYSMTFKHRHAILQLSKFTLYRSNGPRAAQSGGLGGLVRRRPILTGRKNGFKIRPNRLSSQQDWSTIKQHISNHTEHEL